MPTPTFTPSPTNTAVPTFTPSPTVAPTPSPSNTPAPQPIQNPLAGIIIKNSTMRTDPDETSSVVGIAYIGAVFNILASNQDGEWIKINIDDEKIGWARTKNVEIIGVTSYELYKNEDINSPSIEEIGQLDTRIENDWINWIGNLTPDSRYFFRIVNNDQQAIEYCLVPTHIESWDKCP